MSGIPQVPTPAQAAFLADTSREALFVGEPGAGATSALLMGAIGVADGGGHALFTSRSPGFRSPGGAEHRAFDWLDAVDGARFDRFRVRWTLPSGGSITFLDWWRKHGRIVLGWFHAAFVDGLDDFTAGDWGLISSHVRGEPGTMRGSCRPRSRWIVPERSDHGVRHSDNPHLPAGFAESLSAADPDFLAASMFDRG